MNFFVFYFYAVVHLERKDRADACTIAAAGHPRSRRGPHMAPRQRVRGWWGS